MRLSSSYKVKLVKTNKDWYDCLEVLQDTYVDEKNWVEAADNIFPIEDLLSSKTSWFLTYKDKEPAGVLRVQYDPSLNTYAHYDIKLLDDSIDIEKFINSNKFAEIGRFAVKEKFRSNLSIASHLMRAAIKDTIKKEYDYYIKDIFEGEKHNPYLFHTRVIGFKPVATHDTGEINCKNRRITMILNIKECYNRLKSSKAQVFNFFTENWSKKLHLKMSY